MLLLLKESRVQVGLSSTLYTGVAADALWGCRGVPSLPGVAVRSLPLVLCPGAPPSWLSTSEVLPEELSWRRREATEWIKKHINGGVKGGGRNDWRLQGFGCQPKGFLGQNPMSTSIIPQQNTKA